VNSTARAQSARAAAEPLSLQTETNLTTAVRVKAIDPILKQIGSSEVPVLIQGETGVGKEVIARQLCAQSARANKGFLKLNCAALPSELIESELFGYERGAFTGAFQKKPGMFELADGGTILLDEIGDMDFRLQAKLLQVLQDQEFQRLGGKETIRVDVRVIAATHCDLEKAIIEGRFREDLYYRLNVVTIRVPPLRERPDEILTLAEFFLRKHGRPGALSLPITPALHQAMIAYYWPGNIRELENVMRKYIVFRDADLIVDDLRARAMRQGARAIPNHHAMALRRRELQPGKFSKNRQPPPF
jgi:transcriptional regulator with PAS, ATPase and Fis domain